MIHVKQIFPDKDVSLLCVQMPEMLHGERGSMGPLRRFLLQCLGLLVGGAIMLCIALFEEDIAISMGDE